MAVTGMFHACFRLVYGLHMFLEETHPHPTPPRESVQGLFHTCLILVSHMHSPNTKKLENNTLLHIDKHW